jgi:bifunctional DNase/RNase
MEAERDGTIRIVLACVIALAGVSGLMPAAHAQPADTVPVELSTVGLDGRSGTPIVVLREPESGSVLPIWVGPMEAQAIALSLHGVLPPRPMTHDLMASLLSELRASVEEVIVTDLRNNTYFGIVRLRVAGEKKPRDVDSRPSDALALALRTGSPIRVARKILGNVPEFDFVAPEGPNQVVQAVGVTVVVATAGAAEGVWPGRQAGSGRHHCVRRGQR